MYVFSFVCLFVGDGWHWPARKPKVLLLNPAPIKPLGLTLSVQLTLQVSPQAAQRNNLHTSPVRIRKIAVGKDASYIRTTYLRLNR
jgi:hypothetical protein